MYKSKKDVDKHVEKLVSKLSLKDFNARTYSIARLYFDVGDYASCQKYVEQYLTHKSNSAAAHKLLGQTFLKMGFKDKALEEYKISLDLDPAQTNTILDVCEILADDEVHIDPGRAKYWCEKAEKNFPKHAVTFKLRERLLGVANPDPETLTKLLTSELLARPKDALLHIRFIKHLLSINKNSEAFEHVCKTEFSRACFLNNFAWYECLSDVLNSNNDKSGNWLYQLLLLTVKERLSVLSLSEVPQGSSRSLLESNEFLHGYDQAIMNVYKSGPDVGYAEFHSNLLRHHCGQLTFLVATFVLKKAKKNQLDWFEAEKLSSLLLLISWQSAPTDPDANWLTGAPEIQKTAVRRWYLEGAFRCSQSGNVILANNQDKGQIFLDQISQLYNERTWKEKIYDKTLIKNESIAMKNSYFLSELFKPPTLKLPKKIEIQVYDAVAQKLYPNSLHHIVWIVMNYKNYCDFKGTIFDIQASTVTSSGPESLNKLDILAFLYCATFCAQNMKNKSNYTSINMPCLLPANITDLLCSLPQMKWWDCAYKFIQNELGSEFTDIRSTLSRGIEVVRCIDNHGLDPELLCILGRTFSKLSEQSTLVGEKDLYAARACIYYTSAIPLLEKLKTKSMVTMPSKRLFDYFNKELDNKEIITLLQESRLFIALKYYKDEDYIKAIEFLSEIKTPEGYYYLSNSYKNIALQEKPLSKDNETASKYITLLGKAKNYAYKSLEMLKESESYKTLPLYSSIHDVIEDIESEIGNVDSNLSISLFNDCETKCSSDENGSEVDNMPLRTIMQRNRNLSSTPKQSTRQLTNINSTNYRTAFESQVFSNTQLDANNLNVIEEQIKNLQKRDATIEDFKQQTKQWFDENKKLGNEIINTIHSNIEKTTEQFRLLKISVDQVKDQVAECRNECKDVSDLKKQIAELKKEINKLKKSASEQAIDDGDLYNLDEEYRTNENSTYGAQIPFATPQVIPPFTQRLMPPFTVPPNPYQLYGPNFCNLYNQYSQLTQNASVPSTPMFDPNRAQVNYPNIYQTPDQMYLDVAHLVPPTVPPTHIVPPTTSNVLVASLSSITTTTSISSVSQNKTTTQTSSIKTTSQALPVNVVITSSDPLPTCTNTPMPTLSVTIPQKHIKGSPHNYQIPIPESYEFQSVSSPFNSAILDKKSTHDAPSTPVSMSLWTKSSLASNNKPMSLFANDTSKTVIDGPFSSSSPNTSLNKSRTLSEKSNTSVENYDPCPDFKPIIPLPAEVKVTTGEENETVIFCARAKLYRFVDKQWKERGLGEMKLLKHNVTGKVRVLMRREQVHKICANHIIVPEMEIKPMKNETKAYFWVANDYSEETLILEKFCIRFKTADIAKEFFDNFEKARLESSVTPNKSKESLEPSMDLSKTNVNSSQTTETQPGKTTVGGFTFSAKPSFKIVPDVPETKADTAETQVSKVNVFSGLTFKTTASSTPSSDKGKSQQEIESIQTKVNTSDVVEEFEPTVEFKPVVPLPALVEQKTGEEDEIVLFEHRAKLLRFDSQTKEWKERGLGNIKLLVNKENNQKLRLLMRREQIMKVCCNHAVTKEIVFQKMPNMPKAVTWCAKDFSEGELVSETFCLRFKTIQTCDDFIDAVNKAQSNLNNNKVSKEKSNMANQSSESGFGDKFKPKPGSWYCTECYTNNLESFEKCACCENPKSKEINGKAPQANKNMWGDQFKSKPGTWECKQCYVRNQAENEKCSACNNCKNSDGTKTSVSNASTPKFNFGISTKANDQTSLTTTVLGWGNQFKPKEGSWECKQCLVRNEKSQESCSACNHPKDSSLIGTDNKSSIINAPSVTKFNFGMPQKSESKSSITQQTFNVDSAQTFKFGITQNTGSIGKNFGNSSLGDTTVSQTKDSSEVPINFSVNKNNDDVKAHKPALLPTPTTNNLTFGSKVGGSFNFSFKPKSPAKGKSPLKSPKSVKGEDSGDDEYVSDNEGPDIHFSPVVPMPDKIDVVTGEENEEEIYAHRAKLYIFNNSEWKERGIGVVKILKHKDSGKLRVLMRREQVHKICLNHILCPEVIYKPKDEKTWFFAANDFSEGELHLQQFCIRFQNKDVATQFKETLDKAIETKYGPQAKISVNEKESDDVVFISEVQASPEEKERAKELMLPENFFTYTKKQPCEGCRGCENDSEEKLSQGSARVTPTKTLASMLQNNTNSLYGTPTSEKAIDTSIFATPLGSNSFSRNIKSLEISNETNTKSSEAPSGSTAQTSFVSSKSTILAAPKLKSTNTSSEQEITTPKAVFGSKETKNIFDGTENKNIFGSLTTKTLFGSKETSSSNNEDKKGLALSGVSSNRSIFGSAFTASSDQNQKSEVKSVFSSDSNQKPINLFSGNFQGSIFGPTSSNVNESKTSSGIFGQTVNFKFGSDKDSNTKVEENSTSSQLLNATQKPNSAVNTEKKNDAKESNANFEEPVLKAADNFLSFAALSSKKSDFAIQKKSTDFKWEGAGQQLFANVPKTDDANKSDSADKSAAEAGDEEYDPHYEPIVPLPDKIVVTTGEEDEEKLFGERCKLYRFDEKSREWKERGVGEMKILYHPERKTYRLLLRREQVHKAVLNMLIFMDLELLPMKNADRAWTWAGRNYADAEGEQETLAVRFKSVELAASFRDKVLECVRKLQVAAAEEIRKEKEAKENPFESIAPLRLPKHLEDSARADNKITSTLDVNPQSSQNDEQNGDIPNTNLSLKQVHFEEQQENDGEDEDYEHDYDENADDYDGYYNEEEEEESAVYYACDGEVVIEQENEPGINSEAHVQVLFDNDVCSPKILVTDNNTGEILADMLIHTDTHFQISGDSCSWSGLDFTRNTPANKTVTVYFPDSETTMEFYDSCETSKASTYESNDPES